MFLSGCFGTSAPIIQTDSSLPQVGELRTLADMSSVGLEWTPINDERVKGYYLYRSKANSAKLTRVKIIDDRYSSHYSDNDLSPNTAYAYKISTFGYSGKESVPSPLVKVTTNPRIDAVSFVQAVSDLPNRTKVIWRPHTNTSVTGYIVQRRKVGSQDWSKEGTIKGRLSAEYIDIGLNDNARFEYRVIATTDQGVDSKASQTVSATTKPLPHMIKGILATTTEPKKIIIDWQPSTNADMDYYKVYSSPTSVLLFTYLAKTKKPHFEDLINSNGTTRYYKVTVVDKDGLESNKQDDPVKGSTLSAPNKPSFSEASQNGSQVILKWTPVPNAVSYIISKEANGGSKQYIKGINDTMFVDSSIVPGAKYEYNVYAVDRYGLVSDASDDADITMPK